MKRSSLMLTVREHMETAAVTARDTTPRSDLWISMRGPPIGLFLNKSRAPSSKSPSFTIHLAYC